MLYRRYVFAPAPVSRRMIFTLTCGTVESKRHGTPDAPLGLGGHIPPHVGQSLDLVLLLIYLETVTRDGSRQMSGRFGGFRGFLRPMSICVQKQYLGTN